MSQAQYQAVSERALDGVRTEWIEETTPGETPADPSWNAFGDYLKAGPGNAGDPNVTAGEVMGNSDTEDHFRGSKNNTLTLSWWMQRFFVTAASADNDPIGTLLNRNPGTTLPSHSVVWRRNHPSGGNDDAGVRVYTVARGAYPMSGTAPGDPSAAEPIIAEAEYQVAITEVHVIHQPSSGTTLEVASDNADDDSQTLTIENEDAGTTEDVDLNGTTAVTTTATFEDIDAAVLDGETQGDVTVTDGNGTTLTVLEGSDTDGVEGDLGVPALGSGSHASAIGTDPESYLFQGTSTTFGGSHTAASRIHALDLTVEIAMSTEAQQGTRQLAIDPGPRTVSVEADTAGPFESATRYKEYMAGVEGDITYGYPDGDIAIKNAQPTDVDEQAMEAGAANNIFSTTFEGHGDPAVTATHS